MAIVKGNWKSPRNYHETMAADDAKENEWVVLPHNGKA